MNLESSTVTVSKSPEEVFNFLTNVENFEQLMPESIQKFEMLNDTRFLFQLKGMPEIVLEKKETEEFSKVILGAASDKLPFTLTANIEAQDEQNSNVQLVFDGEFNAMMAMMIKKPLQNFINTLSDNITKL
ncbi:SRPBCC family protein [Aquimarina brevivitae]|uniref:Carbon monoxide dehydrogenase subunit G n=1 Tax=Aquimarina brevivitae TaxID=323412 RepID=A0A4Q7PHT1_9FLAO|nr:SRPBCC family protein [Aquimarina brevivitae]RZT00117.1 hypothetical protein EV197_1350 [Aquimarina brevivitae]